MRTDTTEARRALWASIIVEETGCSTERALSVVDQLWATRAEQRTLNLMAIRVGEARSFPLDRRASIFATASKMKKQGRARFEIETDFEGKKVNVRRLPLEALDDEPPT